MLFLMLSVSLVSAFSFSDLSLNKYAYARNNPVMYTDPTGHCPICLAAYGILAWGLGIGTVAGGIDIISQIWGGSSISEGTVDWGSAGSSFTTGFAGGSAGAATFSLGPIVIPSVGPEILLGGSSLAGSVVGTVTHNALSGNELGYGLDDNSLASVYAGSIAAGGILSRVIPGSWVGGKSKTNFYVKPNGEAVPATGYHHLGSNSKRLASIKEKGVITPKHGSGTYITFDDITDPNSAQRLLSTKHDAVIRARFDTLQIIDDLKIPPGGPLTRGETTQAVSGSSIIIDDLADLRNVRR